MHPNIGKPIELLNYLQWLISGKGMPCDIRSTPTAQK
jgi:hypothetical protein